MDSLFYFFKAWVMGIAIAAPVGPIGMLCIRKTLEFGLRGTLTVGLGAALGDSIYGFIAAVGLTAVSHFLLSKMAFLKIIGGIFLLYLAYKEIKTKSSSSDIVLKKDKGFMREVSEVFFLTLINPMTILTFLSVFASIGKGSETYLESLIMMGGVFLGSMTWWLILGGVILKIKHLLPEIWISRIRYISAMILAGFGIFALLV